MKTITELRSEYDSDEEFGQAILREVISLAKENPDYVYRPVEGRFYSYTSGANGSKGCIIGQALQKLNCYLDMDGISFGRVCEMSDIDYVTESITKLRVLQYNQDAGMNWGSIMTQI